MSAVADFIFLETPTCPAALADCAETVGESIACPCSAGTSYPATVMRAFAASSTVFPSRVTFLICMTVRLLMTTASAGTSLGSTSTAVPVSNHSFHCFLMASRILMRC